MNQDEIEALTDTYRSRASALDDATRKKFYQEYHNNLKDPDTFATLCYFFVVGLHYIYLKRYLRATLVLLFMTLGSFLIYMDYTSILGWSVVIVVLMIEVSNLFRSQSIVTQYNLHLMNKLLNKYEKLNNQATLKPIHL